jgi:DNA repair protein RadC
MPEQSEIFPEQVQKRASYGVEGHRSRLTKRLLDGGAEALSDHEAIECLLITAIPRRDVKPMARALIQRFGSLAARRLACQQVREQPVLGSWQALIDYLTIDMAQLTVERVRVLFLNRWNSVTLTT